MTSSGRSAGSSLLTLFAAKGTLRVVLSHRIYRVLPALMPYIEHLWMARGYLSKNWRNMILPDGAVELIVNLGDPQRLCDPRDHSKSTLFRHSWVSGERREPIVIDEEGHVDLVGVRFKPGGAWPFLSLPISEFTGRVVELEAILGREAEELSGRMSEVSDEDERFRLLQSWLLLRLRRGAPPTPAVRYALNLIRSGTEGLRIGHIPEKIGVSHKHLLREFDRCVGLPPKLFARLCAFQRAIGSIAQKTELNWADVATTCGYYDQAHFIHEFRAFSGFTPTMYLSRRGPYLNYLSLE